MHPKIIISNYFDSLINSIDIHTEYQLEQFTEIDDIVAKKPFDFEENEKYLFQNTNPKSSKS